MARQRLVKPEVFQHEELHRAETVSALPLVRAYIGLWCQADRRGCFAWRPARLKLHVCPFDTLDFEDVLTALENAGFVRSYVVEGRKFGYIPAFARHQTFHKNERPDPLIPDPPVPVPAPAQHGASTVQAPSQHSVSTPVSISVSSTGTGAVSVAVDGPTATTVGEVALTLTRTANAAIMARFGEQVHPLLSQHAKSHALAQDVVEGRIPTEFAARSIARQCERIEKPVGTMAYFLKGILDDWAAHNERLAAATAPHVQPLELPAHTRGGDTLTDYLLTHRPEGAS